MDIELKFNTFYRLSNFLLLGRAFDAALCSHTNHRNEWRKVSFLSILAAKRDFYRKDNL